MSSTATILPFSRPDAAKTVVPIRPAPVARRAAAHLRDDFGVQAENPERVAELLIVLERFAPTEPVIVLVRERGVDRVQFDHAGHTLLLTPADARLAAGAIEADAADYPGGLTVAHHLREAALRLDFGQPMAAGAFTLVDGAEAIDRPGPVLRADDDDPAILRTAGASLLAIGAVIAGLVILMLATGRA